MHRSKADSTPPSASSLKLRTGRSTTRAPGPTPKALDFREQAQPSPDSSGATRSHPENPLCVPCTQARRAWLLDGRVHRHPVGVRSEGCPSATDRAHPLGTMQALAALARPGKTVCSVCDAAEALLPILAHGQDDVTSPTPDHRVRRSGRRCGRGGSRHAEEDLVVVR
ncbi:DUF6233 domain-containing protein [Streptomyces sp. NPDC054932]